MKKQVKFKNYFNEYLSGILENSRSGHIILLLHGFCGNKDENGLFSECAKYFLDRGLNTFRFDVSGVGESEGEFEYSSLRKQASDLNAVVDNLAEKSPYSKLGLVGFSLGAAVALQSRNPRIRAYSFWSPAFFPSKDMFPRYNSIENRVQLKEKGHIQKNGVKIGREMMEDIREFDASEILSYFSIPAQIIHGTKDPRIDYRSSINAMKYLNHDSSLVLIEGANHSYKDNPAHRYKVFKESADWFISKLK